MSFGLTADGFKKKRLADIKSEIETALIDGLGENVTTIPQSVFGVIIGILSEREALEWESMEAIYLAMYPSSAQGVSLDNVVEFAGLTRLENETDAQLRDRYDISVTAKGRNNKDSLFGQLLQLKDVVSAKVADNKTDTTDSNGLPPHTFTAIVQGGTDENIAQIIWDNTPEGIASVGDKSVIITDQQGDGQSVYFTRPTNVPIYFIVNVTTDSNYPLDGNDQIKQAIVDYGTANFTINETVIHSKFYVPINSVDGITDIKFFIGTSASPTLEDNIPIGLKEVSSYNVANIVVNAS